MSHLHNGIKVRCLTANRIDAPRLWINNGTIAAQEYQPPLPNYDPAARLPRQHWRMPSATEQQQLYADGPVAEGSLITVLPMPAAVLAPFQAVREASRATDVEPLRSLVESPQVALAIATAQAYVTSLSAKPDHPIEGGFIFVGYPGKVTLTYAAGPYYIGLHVDSFYQVPLEERATSPNRICINLGAGNRYLYFINLPLVTIKQQLDEGGATDPKRLQIGSPLGRAFMECFPDYPVIKLRVAPGEAYIAPTENIIHDGSSLGNCYFDTHLTFRGYFTAS